MMRCSRSLALCALFTAFVPAAFFIGLIYEKTKKKIH